MGLSRADLPPAIASTIAAGTVIPAHPLALTRARTLDERRQRALTRYYLDAGSGGVAIGVHTTQFAIRERGLYARVLEIAAEEARTWTTRPAAMIAGAIGDTRQAVREASIARGLGYHAVLLGLAQLAHASDDELVAHCRAVANEMPLVGFYLQTAVGGRVLSARFWERFAAIDNVVAIKIAPFNRYRTQDVVRGVVAARAEDRVALYTGNDDHIVLDLLSRYDVPRGGERVRVRIAGGLLGHWSVWTRHACELFARIAAVRDAEAMGSDWLAVDAAVTDCNAAFFDVANGFAGCIAGCHEVLRRQGMLEGIECLDPAETLGPGQAAEIDRVYAAYPELNDDAFVAAHRARWLES
jgi:hypothetical protein